MNINKTLFEKCKNLLGCDHEKIEEFLFSYGDFNRRQELAQLIIEDIMNGHNKGRLRYHIAQLARIEHAAQNLNPRLRDHVVHAVLCYILGVYVLHNCLKTDEKPKELEWKLASLFHDIGYPLEVMNKLDIEFLESLNGYKRRINPKVGHDQDFKLTINLEGFDKLTNGKNSFDLIQECLNEWDLKINARRTYQNMFKNGRICHGMISSLILLQVIDLMYNQYNPKEVREDKIYEHNLEVNYNYKHFINEVIPACTAIFIHNLPMEYFVEAKIDRSKAPVAYLLKLSDTLQEWERPSKKEPDGLNAQLFNIGLNNNGKLIIYAGVNGVAEKMRNELSQYLAEPDIEICNMDLLSQR